MRYPNSCKRSKVLLFILLSFLLTLALWKPMVGSGQDPFWLTPFRGHFKFSGIRFFEYSGDDFVAAWDHSIGIWSSTPGAKVKLASGFKMDGLIGLWTSPTSTSHWAAVRTTDDDQTNNGQQPLGGSYCAVTFFDGSGMPAGVIDVEIKATQAEDCLGFSKDGKQFFYAAFERGIGIGSIDTNTGNLAQPIKINSPDIFDHAFWHMTKVTPDGKVYVLCMGDEMVAKDFSGKELWRIISGEGDSIYGYWHQPAIADGICVFSGASNKLYMIDIAKGKPFAEFDGVSHYNFLAVSQDCHKLAIATDSGIEIRTAGLPKQMWKTITTQGKIECKFSFDGKELFGMPSLKQTKVDEQTHTATIARESSIITVWDVESGRVLKNLNLAPSK